MNMEFKRKLIIPKEIFESIAGRDKERASRAAKLHIDNQEKSIIRQIRLEIKR